MTDVNDKTTSMITFLRDRCTSLETSMAQAETELKAARERINELELLLAFSQQETRRMEDVAKRMERELGGEA